ncbi:hypothetical protein AB0F88_42915 [Streptosporangium sp. NPDC023963]|uniref:hypothetical protein n=1 Tax=Streptosporangium sp. NPDC023963 TaxID=3155608 RepID=UPI003437257D
MTEYSWPDDGAEIGRRAQAAWSATCRALPIGTQVTGTVTSRQPFGVFLRIDGTPEAIGLAESIAMPPDFELPRLGAFVTGEVISHTEHNHQVRTRLTEQTES